MPSNKCSTSYGIVVKTRDNRIVVLRRKVPYCVQNYYHRLDTRTRPSPHFIMVRQQFEAQHLPRMKPHEQLDYQRFIHGQPYEDLLDFPHGQLQNRKTSHINSLFFEAYREFQEESGFHFKFSKKDIQNYPLVELQFTGCDGFQYWQFYFIVENVVGLKRHGYFNSFDHSCAGENQLKSWRDDRLVYEGKLMEAHVVYEKLWKQQSIKEDWKQLLCPPVSQIFQWMKPVMKHEKDPQEEGPAQPSQPLVKQEADPSQLCVAQEVLVKTPRVRTKCPRRNVPQESVAQWLAKTHALLDQHFPSTL